MGKDVAYIFPSASVVKNLPANAGDTGDVDLIPGSGYPLKEERATQSIFVFSRGDLIPTHSYLENSMDRGDWQATVHGVAKET